MPAQAASVSSDAPALSTVVKARVPHKAHDGVPASATPLPRDDAARTERPDSRPGGFNFGDRPAGPTPGMFPAPTTTRGTPAPAGAGMFNQPTRTRPQPAAQLPTRTPASSGAGAIGAAGATAAGSSNGANPLPSSHDGPMTDDGLAMRTPGRTITTNIAAISADEGSFRRLPMPGEAPMTDDDAIASRRLRMIGELQGGVGRGRSSQDPEVRPAPQPSPQAPPRPVATPAHAAPVAPAAAPHAPAPEPTSLFAARTPKPAPAQES